MYGYCAIHIQSEICRHKICGKVLKAFNPIPFSGSYTVQHSRRIIKFIATYVCMWMVVRRCGHGPTIRNHKSLCHVVPEQLRYRYPLSAIFDEKPWNGFAYKFNSIFSWFYCCRYKNYMGNNRPLTNPRGYDEWTWFKERVDGRRSNRFNNIIMTQLLVTFYTFTRTLPFPLHAPVI